MRGSLVNGSCNGHPWFLVHCGELQAPLVPAPLMNRDGGKQENWSVQNSASKRVLHRKRCHALKTAGATASQVLAQSLARSRRHGQSPCAAGRLPHPWDMFCPGYWFDSLMQMSF